ncbi:Ubiquitin carboxyl-terminal hydrolase family protein [Quillaja saponaria]|uniref:Ubiquitin carboxyl-terminal hydrolase family protein n=1 Tax=Quillaja saponaria TaxID=32244 RepID=A0AAD7PCE4_QUISA|nr:Ubiquitin carboxyl-terminal hydrolase family protein [Quillaja saponaria]
MSFTWQPTQDAFAPSTLTGAQVTRGLSTVSAMLTPVPTMHTESPTPAVLPCHQLIVIFIQLVHQSKWLPPYPSFSLLTWLCFEDLVFCTRNSSPYLKRQCPKHPELWTRRPQEYSNEFSLWGFHALGRVLEFLRTVRIRDITSERKREFSRLWLELRAFGFDLTWLEPSYQKVMTCSIDEPKIKRFEELKGEVISLAKDLREKIAELTEASKNLTNPD